MNIRNPKYTMFNDIDCEILHNIYGWIPFTASKNDPEPMGKDVYNKALEMGPEPFVVEEVSPEVLLQNKRAQMRCSRLQGRITLGEAVCASLDALAADPTTPWAMREAIKNAGEWQRNSPTMDELGWLLGYTPEQMDALFEQAVTVEV